jgi:hypothetical protein
MTGFWRFHYSLKYSLTHPWIWLREFYWSLKYAWQRAFRGWDDTVIWGIDYYLAEYIPIWLKALKETKRGTPAACFNDDELQGDAITPEAEERAIKHWNEILDKIIAGFEAAYQMEEWKHTDDLQAQFDEGFKLFHEYFFSLWD